MPRKRLQYALSAGAVAGVLNALLNIAVVLLNTGTFQQENKELSVNKLTVNTALAIAGIGFLNLFFIVVICIVTGYVVGRIAVQRRLGFFAGILVGVIVYVVTYLVRYIPGYPDHIAASGTRVAGDVVVSIAFSLVVLLIWGIIGGLLSLFGSWIATLRHPYYAR